MKLGFYSNTEGGVKMSHIVNWIKFKIQKALGIHELVEKADMLERECVDLSAKLGAVLGDSRSNGDNINKLFATTSDLRILIEQLDTTYHLDSNDQQWKKEEEIDFIQKSYE